MSKSLDENPSTMSDNIVTPDKAAVSSRRNNTSTSRLDSGDIKLSIDFQNYLDSNPILTDNYKLLFNNDFCKLYEFAIATNDISPDLVHMENIEFGINILQVVFYGRTRQQYDSIYNQTHEIDRQQVPSICVRTRSKDSDSDVFNDNHYDDYDIKESIVLNKKIHQLLLFVLNSKSSTTSQSINQNVTIDLLSSDDDEITEQNNADNSQDNENKQIQLINSSASNDASILPDILFDCVYQVFTKTLLIPTNLVIL